MAQDWGRSAYAARPSLARPAAAKHAPQNQIVMKSSRASADFGRLGTLPFDVSIDYSTRLSAAPDEKPRSLLKTTKRASAVDNQHLERTIEQKPLSSAPRRRQQVPRRRRQREARPRRRFMGFEEDAPVVLDLVVPLFL